VCLHALALSLPLDQGGEGGRRGKVIRRLATRLRQRREQQARAGGPEAAAESPLPDLDPVLRGGAGCWVGERDAALPALGPKVVAELRIPCAPIVAFAPAEIAALVMEPSAAESP